MRKMTAILISLIALALCVGILCRFAQRPAPHEASSAATVYTEDVPAESVEGPEGLPTPTL